MSVKHQWTSKESQEAIRKVAGKAATDADFRQKALTNPGAAVREVTGKPLPEGFKLRFVDNDGADLTVPIPDLVGDVALTDEQLAGIAGGADSMIQAERQQTRYTFFEAWPSKWKGFSLDGKG